VDIPVIGLLFVYSLLSLHENWFAVAYFLVLNSLYYCIRFVQPINPETGTNPIDRSIAELLFRQTPGPTIRNIEEASSPKSRVSVSYLVNI
jgi:hypothetical protein